MTWVAVIVLLLVVLRTRAILPLVTKLADAEFAPLLYVVDDVSLIVTFSPAEVTRVKPDLETLLTLPIDPPAAGPDRARAPRPPGAEGPEEQLELAVCAPVVEGVVAAIELDVPQAESPIAATISPVVTHGLLLCDRSRRSLERGVRR